MFATIRLTRIISSAQIVLLPMIRTIISKKQCAIFSAITMKYITLKKFYFLHDSRLIIDIILSEACEIVMRQEDGYYLEIM